MNTNTRPTEKGLRAYLQNIIDLGENQLDIAVAREALSHDNAIAFFKDLANHGCISGMIGFLIYNKDTHAFFDKHYYDIEIARHEIEDMTGEPIHIQGDLKTGLAWVAFEETAYKIAVEVGLL